MIKATEIKITPIKEIKPNPKNNNKHPKDQLDRIEKIISAQGFRSPLVISNQSGLLVAGHARLQVAKKLGYKELPVIFQDFKDEAEEYAHMTADNALQAWSELDFSAINNEFINFGPDFDVDLLGIKDFGLETQKNTEQIEKEILFSFKIEVECINEQNQQELTEELENRGFKVRVLI